MTAPGLATTVRRLLAAHTAVDPSSLSDDDDLWRWGLTSQASVDLMLAVEEEYGIELPDELLRRSNFSSIGAICGTLATVGVACD